MWGVVGHGPNLEERVSNFPSKNLLLKRNRPTIYGKSIFNKGAKTTQWEKKVFLTNSVGSAEHPYGEKNIDPYLIQHTCTQIIQNLKF